MSPRVNRRFQMRRVESGDYLLLSNDEKTLWRIVSYTEGKSAGLEGARSDWTEWRVHRFSRPYAGIKPDDLEHFDAPWIEVASGFRKRQDAIDYALTYQPATLPADPRPKPSLQDSIRAMVVRQS